MSRVAVVTGGSSGIGAAVARRLAARDWTLVLLARGEERLRSVAEELGAEWHSVDIGDRNAVAQVAAAVQERHPRISLLVNNAGASTRSDFFHAEPEKLENDMRVNYLGAVWCVRSLLPALERAAPSDIVNVASIAATLAFSSSGPYIASKHALIAFSRATTVELRRHGIRVHAVLPGLVETPGFPQRSRLPSILARTVIEPEQVAERILEILAKDIREAYVPRWYRAVFFGQCLAPGPTLRFLERLLPGKPLHAEP
jgi:short-subunit dehydrogenase